MSISSRQLRYGHDEGHTDVCYADDGKRMISCGNDGDVRIWSGIDDADAISFAVGDNPLSVAHKKDSVYVCTDNGRVVLYQYPTDTKTKTLTRFAGLATHVTVAKNSDVIACVSEEFVVKVFKSPDDTDCVHFNDLKGVALGVSLSPNGQYVAVSCGDGSLYIWDVPDKKLVKDFNVVPYTNSFTEAKHLCRTSFDPKGKYFAYPHHKDVIILSVDHFEKLFTLVADVDASLSIVQYSPCGKYIAASSSQGDICIWHTNTKNTLAVSPHDRKYNVSALAWNPLGNGEIAFCDVNGQIGTVKFSPGLENDLSMDIPQDDQIGMIGVADDDDEDDENGISLEKLRNETLGIGSPAPTVLSGEATSRAASPDRPSSPPCLLQPPFQSGSTPAHLSQRFLAYNDVGIVRLYNEEDEGSSIDVQFHDASFYKNLFMKNHLNHTMASLSTGSLTLACEAPSKLVCIPLKVGVKEWIMDMSDLEEILCIGTSSVLVVAATNTRMLRIFSVFGTQLAVLSIPGPAISVAAFEKCVFVVYHASTAYSKDQNLAGLLVHLNDRAVVSKVIPIAITPQSTLTWIGFTEVGSLASYDSAGIVRICKVDSVVWVPVCDTSNHTKGVSDTFFLTYVSEKSQTIRVIYCKGALYPPTIPLPLLSEISMQLPFCEIETDKTQMEEKLFRWSFLNTDEPEKSFKETAIKLFALACRNNMEERALELLALLNSPQLVVLAMKYAGRINRNRLYERLNEMHKNMEGEELESEESTSTNDVSIRPVIRRNKPSEPTPSADSQQSYSPDLFSNSTFTESPSYKEETLIQKSVVKNPFLKNTKVEQKRNPLSLTNAPEDEEHNKPATSKPSSLLNTKSSNEEKKPVQTNGNKTGETFQEWYSKQKPDLEKEHPEMNTTDLVKHALKLFKKQAEKRKATDDAENTQKPKQSKLSAFAFGK